MNNNVLILVVDDDKEIANGIKKLLELEGYNVITAYDGLEALDKLTTNNVNLLLIDVMMPKLDGLSTIIKVREKNNIPIMILSAKTEDSDKILGLSIGADDYIPKPFNSQVLIAKIKSMLRRTMVFNSNSSDIITIRGLKLDTKKKTLHVDGVLTKLTATEYHILNLLMSNPGQVFSAEHIYTNIWNDEPINVENTIMVHIRRIREKIEIDTKKPNYLKVVWGIGYKID